MLCSVDPLVNRTQAQSVNAEKVEFCSTAAKSSSLFRGKINLYPFSFAEKKEAMEKINVTIVVIFAEAKVVSEI